MSRPTLAATMICKNEIHNFPKLLESLKGCVDEFCIVDTGSTDGTKEYLADLMVTGKDIQLYGAPIRLGFFDWINDFAAARNETFKLVNSDYIFWVDLDDILVDAKTFITWRDTAMQYADYWLAAYDYAQDEKGVSQCKFIRERVVNFKKAKIEWEYFVHEGIKPPPGYTVQSCVSWYIKHQRTPDDMKQDKARNLNIFKGKTLNHRMQFYYGKELFENDQPMEAYVELTKAIDNPDLELHDKLLAIQYAGYAAINCGQFQKARDICLKGIAIAPTRAEYHIIIADSYLKENRLLDAIPYLGAAKECINQHPIDGKHFSPIYNMGHLYTYYPRDLLAKAKFHTGRIDDAIKEAEDCLERYKEAGTRAILEELQKNKKAAFADINTVTKTDDIVITCPPQQAYPWDEKVYREKGVGGSETAAVEMTEWLKKKTGRRVMIFHPRDKDFVSTNGVEYKPQNDAIEYFSKYEPRVHIAWRHNIKATQAPTYLWCHDLMTPSVEQYQNFDKILCLSQFHKKYVMAMQGVPEEKIIVTRNGLDTSRFANVDNVIKNPNKIIWPNSPDRGLERAIAIMDEAKKTLPDLELHVFYGLENLEKFGLADKAKMLRGLIAQRPWITYHGNVDQKTLAQHFMESVVWLYPANFIETYCISAIESLSAKCYPLVRTFGALEDTVRLAHDQGMATMLDLDASTPDQIAVWSKELVNIINDKRWERVTINPSAFTWESVADEWIKFLEL